MWVGERVVGVGNKQGHVHAQAERLARQSVWQLLGQVLHWADSSREQSGLTDMCSGFLARAENVLSVCWSGLAAANFAHTVPSPSQSKMRALRVAFVTTAAPRLLLLPLRTSGGAPAGWNARTPAPLRRGGQKT